MWRCSFVLFTIAVCAILKSSGLCSAADGSEVPSVAEIDRQVVAARNKIKSGRFVVKVRRTDCVDARRSFDFTIDNVIDGARFLEVVDNHGSGKDFCASDGDYFEYWQPADRSNIHRALVWREAKFVDRSSKMGEYGWNSPLKLMMIPGLYAVLGDAPSDTMIGSPLRRNIAIEPTRWQGTVPAWKITCTRRGEPVAYWVVPGWGYNVVRIETGSADGDPVVSTTETCILAEVAQGIWFPKATTVEYYLRGKLQFREAVEVSLSRVNDVFAPSTFGPAAMDLPIGTPVAHVPLPAGPEFLKWDGNKIAPMSAIDVARLRGLSTPSGHRIRWGYVILSSLLAFIGVFLAFRRGKRIAP